MKINPKTVAPLSAALLCACNTYATVIASDSFETTGTDAYADDRLYGQSPTDGTTGFDEDTAWTGNFNTGDVEIDSTGLTASLVSNASGGSATTDGASSDRTVTRELSSYTLTDSTYYFSFLFYVNEDGTSNSSAFGLSTADLTANYADPQSGVMISIEGASGTAGASSSLSLWVDGDETAFDFDLTTGTTYFALVEITNSTTGSDSVIANIYSSTATDLTVSLSSASDSSSEISDQLTSLTILQDFGGTGTLFDEFYYGTSISDVSSIPEPSTFAMLAGIGALAMVMNRRRRS
jgi:hypothetical protein